jgi:hypothetical protein
MNNGYVLGAFVGVLVGWFGKQEYDKRKAKNPPPRPIAPPSAATPPNKLPTTAINPRAFIEKAPFSDANINIIF